MGIATKTDSFVPTCHAASFPQTVGLVTVANELWAFRFEVPRSLLIYSTHFFIVTPSVGGLFSYGVWDPLGLTRFLYSGVISTGSAGVKATNFSGVVLEAGATYWFAQTCDNAIATCPQNGLAPNFSQVVNAGFIEVGFISGATVGGAMPEVLPLPLTTGGGRCPIVKLFGSVV